MNLYDENTKYNELAYESNASIVNYSKIQAKVLKLLMHIPSLLVPSEQHFFPFVQIDSKV